MFVELFIELCLGVEDFKMLFTIELYVYGGGGGGGCKMQFNIEFYVYFKGDCGRL